MSIEGLVSGTSRSLADSFDLRYDAGDVNSEVGYVFDELMTKHHGGKGHPESPDRISAIHTHLRRSGLLNQTRNLSTRSASKDEIVLAHNDELVDRVFAFESDPRLIGAPLEDQGSVVGTQREYLLIESDTFVCHATPASARLAAGAVLQLCDAVMDPQSSVKRGFAAIRPPGHHATADRSMGFCLFNNVAIAARYLQTRHNLRRVAIIDWDVHHGNGTSDIFKSDPSVLFISSHRYDKGLYYPKTGHLIDIGAGEGVGYNANIPIDGSFADDDLDYIFNHVVLPLLDFHKPEAILVSAGFDAAVGDPLGECDVSPGFFGDLTVWLLRWCNDNCSGRLLMCLEGGYDLKNIACASEACIKALIGSDKLVSDVPALQCDCAFCESDLTVRSAATTARSVPSSRPRSSVVATCHKLTTLLVDSGVDIAVSPYKLKRKVATPSMAPVVSLAPSQPLHDPLFVSGGGHLSAFTRAAPGWVTKETKLSEGLFYVLLNEGVASHDSPNRRSERQNSKNRPKHYTALSKPVTEMHGEFQVEYSIVEYPEEVSAFRTGITKTNSSAESVSSSLDCIRPFIPECRRVTISDTGLASIVLADITEGFKSPCILDIKLGTSYVCPGDSPARRKEMEKKAATTAAHRLGIRLTACAARDYRLEKALASRMTFRHQFIAVMRRFAFYAESRAEEIMNMAADECERILACFEGIDALKFVASSLIFCYDAAAPSFLRVSLVDFTHVFPAESKDLGLIKGLRELVSLWQRAAEGPQTLTEGEEEDDSDWQ